MMVGSALSEKRLLWHPRQDNKFVVGGGSQITLYEWASDYPEIRHVTSQHDLQFMKCFAWSPDPTFEDLIAVGLSTGRVDLIRLEASKYARHPNVLTNGPSVSLPMRNTRSCNALAFCTADPNYLAVGLDKVRGDCSLVIWDISTTSPSLSMSPLSSSNIAGGAGLLSRPQPQIPRADIGPRTDARVLQQHAPTEIVSSLCFLPQSTNLLLAGISHRWLRLFDLRSPVPSTTNVASKVHGIATDPFDQNRIGCFGDGVVTIWDARKLPHPILTLTEKDAVADGAQVQPNSAYAGIEFSSTRRGTLATLEKDASYVRFWDLLQAQAHTIEGSSDGDRSRDSSMSNRAARRSWTNLPWAAGHQMQSSPKDLESHPSLVAFDTRKTKNFSRPLASFALVPSAQTHPLTSNVMVVNKEGDLELYAVHDTPKHPIWSARGDLAIGAGQHYRILSGFHEVEPPPEPWEAPPKPHHPYNASMTSHSHSQQAREESAMRSRGRSKPNSTISAPTLFGRGDEDGFPALTTGSTVVQPPTNLAATRPGKSRTYSPASLRNYNYRFEYSGGSSADSADPRSRSRPESNYPDQLNRGSSGGRHGEKSSSRARKQPLKTINHVVEDDISMIMRHRTIRGYGLGKPQSNITVMQDDSDENSQTLSELWAWIHHSREFLCMPTSRLHGFDFSYEGLLGIWEGFQPIPRQQNDLTPVSVHRDLLDLPAFPTNQYEGHGTRRSHSPADDLHGNFRASLETLAARKGADKSTWKPTVSTGKLVQRQVALQLCGWSLKEEDLTSAIKRWEKDGKHSRAACWLVFTRQYAKAVDLLMRSDDESHHMMSGTLAALIPHGSGSSTKSIELREHCERLIVRLQDPYFRAMLTHLTLGEWPEVLEEETIPFRERLAIAFQFLDDKSLTSYLRRTMERSCARGDIDAIIVTGLTKPGMDILQSYIDRTGDVQTAAILASYVCPSKFMDVRVEHWLDSYRDLLDGFKLHHHRVGFDIERGQILQDAMQNGDARAVEWVPRQIMIRCNYCNKAISAPTSAVNQKGRATACPNCNRALPRCSICLMTLGVVQDGIREAELGHSPYRDTIDDAIVICQTCRHGGHASHILDWFFGEDGIRSHGICAVADCDCHCADEY